MDRESHYRSLEKMYLAAPINAFYKPKIAISREYAQILADSVVFDDQGREIGRGNGLFVRGKIRLSEVGGYVHG